MADENAPEEPSENAPEAEPEEPAGPPAPFRLVGSDGSERGPYNSLELAQAAKDNAVGVHEGEGHEFVIRDANGEAIG